MRKTKEPKTEKAKVKKPIYKRWWFWVLVVLILLMGAGSGGSGDQKADASPSPAPAAVTAEPEQSAEPEPEPEPAAEPEAEPTPARDNPLDAIALSQEEKREVYREYRAALDEAYTTGPAANADPEEASKIEDDLAQQVADAHGITAEEVKLINGLSFFGYLYDVDPAALKIHFGDMVEAQAVNTSLIVKAKIKPGMNNKMTVTQNYYNVCDLICNQGCGEFDEIQYWAVADMSDGSESKVISFTVPKDVIEVIARNDVNAFWQELDKYVTDLWILPSLAN